MLWVFVLASPMTIGLDTEASRTRFSLPSFAELSARGLHLGSKLLAFCPARSFF